MFVSKDRKLPFTVVYRELLPSGGLPPYLQTLDQP